jgi:hypothetical protein
VRRRARWQLVSAQGIDQLLQTSQGLAGLEGRLANADRVLAGVRREVLSHLKQLRTTTYLSQMVSQSVL